MYIKRLDSMLAVLVVLCILGIAMPAQSIVYVDKMAPRPGGVEDGLSWATAFDTIQEGIDLAWALGGDQVWVAGGPNGGGYIYDEDRPNVWGNLPVMGSLILEENVQLYGGFEGYHGLQETNLNQRNPRLAITVIDGSRSRGGAPAYHVIVVGKQTGAALNIRIDGFTITGGYAVGLPGDYHTWRGGGLYNWGGTVTVSNCHFIGNRAAVSGGAIANERTPTATPLLKIENTVFYQNRAERKLDTAGNPIRGGGAIFSNQADITVLFSTFVENTVDTTAGGMYGLASGGYLGFNTSTSSIINSSIFWENTPSGGLCLQTVCPAGSPITCGIPTLQFTNANQNQNPFFSTVPPEFELQSTSPFHDTGDPVIAFNNDVRMVPRPQNFDKDRGAYETVITPLRAVCRNDQSVSLDATGNASIPALDLIDLINSVVPGGIWYAKVDGHYIASFNCNDYPSKTVSVTLIENTGRQATCQATVTVRDLIPPVARCKDITVSLDSTGHYTLSASEINDGSSDNCTVILNIPPTVFNCSDVGQTFPITLNVSDPASNSNQCVANVTVEDNIPPNVITKSIFVQLDATGNVSILPLDVDNGSTDNCGIQSMNLDVQDFTCADIGPNVVNLTVTDVNGNSASAPATVTVQDNILPAVVTKDITVALNSAGQVLIQPEDIDNGTTDNCDFTLQVIPSVLTCANLGDNSVTLRATDEGGNISNGVATVTVEDNIPPTVLTKNAVVYLDATGQVVIQPSDVDDGSYDNCPIASMTVVPNTFTCAHVGSLSHEVTLTVFDEAGNSSSETAEVVVMDNLPPTVLTKNITIDLDAEGNARITPGMVDNGSSDNCEIAYMELDEDTFTCADLGDNIVTLTVHDVNGNSDSAQATVTVRDVTPPMITVRAGSQISLKIGVDCYNEEGAYWTDACDGTGEAIIGGDTVPSNCPLQVADEGDYVVTYDYTDTSGNPAEQKTLTVHVVRNYPPVITLNGDNPMFLDCKEPYNELGYTAIDPEDGDLTEEVIVTGEVDPFTPGTYFIEYKVTDHDPQYPMTTIINRTVHVVDNDLPELTLEGPAMFAWQAGEPWVDPGYSAEDYCWGDVTSLVVIDGAVDVNNPGMYLLTYTPYDGSGNPGEPKEREVYVGNLLQIIEHPHNQDAYVDSNTFELSVTITGGVFLPNYDTYTWYRNSEPVEHGFLMPSEVNTLELVVDPSTLSPDTYLYSLEINDLEKTHVSNNARVRIANHLQLVSNIPNAEVVIGDDFSMTVNVSGGIGTLNYQWQKATNGGKAWENLVDGGNISGANEATLIFTPFEEDDGGQYRCVISDEYTDLIYSNTVTLTAVKGIPAVGIVGLSILTALSALAGAFTLRKRQK